jgi:hypothetical protein
MNIFVTFCNINTGYLQHRMYLWLQYDAKTISNYSLKRVNRLVVLVVNRMCFLWGRNLVFVFYLCERAVPFCKFSNNINNCDVMQSSNCENQIQP